MKSEQLNQAFDWLQENTDSDAWRELMEQGNSFAAMPHSVSREAYAALFGSDLGREVFGDLMRRYVLVTRCNPNEQPATAYYREGMAQVVLDIADMIATPEENDGQEG